MDPPKPLPAPLILGDTHFQIRLRTVTYSVILFVLVVHLLEKFRDILLPFFVAMFIGFLMHPFHRWLVKRGMKSLLAYGVMVVMVALGAFAVGGIIYANITQVRAKLPDYEKRLETMVRSVVMQLPLPKQPDLEGHFLREIHIVPDQLVSPALTALGRFGDITSWAILTLVYLLFLIAEKVGFPHRLTLALGGEHGRHVMSIVESISEAIGEYIAVKTLVSALAGILSYIVLAIFDVDFAATWGVLIFLLNYIPYLGSLIAVSLPILLSFLQFDEVWKGIVIAGLLIGIQQVIGTFLEPRMAGHRLGVSPLLILLSLAFWGAIWGPVGMILAVPLLVVCKIVFDNIQETKPLATLISNR
jgi:AI-2 transport protein TqsA